MTASTLDSAIALPEIVFSAGAARWKIRVSDAVSLAVSMDFERRQPSLFGVPLARCGPLRVGSFIGSVSQGGSCNVDVVQALIPHCQGTHTESVGHIVSESVAIGRVCLSPLLLAQVVSVTPMSSGTHVDSYRPPIEADDRVISAKSLNAAMTALPTWSTGDESPRISALIVRTLPNSEQKRHTVYAVTDCVPYFSVEAMDRIDELGFDHLLTDLPSIDRLNDSGWLTNHHRFFGIPERTHVIAPQTRAHRTITEFIYVPDSVADGTYALALHVPDWILDAAPSRPILYPLELTE